jgi:hypothetical protein
MASNFDHMAFFDANSADASKKIIIDDHFAAKLKNENIIQDVQEITVCYSLVNY